MTEMDRLYRWNRWYDEQPESWRSSLIIWGLVVIAAFNTALTIWTGFPLLLLVVLALIGLALVRVPYKAGWLRVESGEGDAPARMQIEAPRWVHDANAWYDSLPEGRRPLVVLTILVVAGAINMLLTFSSGFAFGLLFLLVFLALIAIRVPYTSGWLKPMPASMMLAQPASPAMPVAAPAQAAITGQTAPPARTPAGSA
jgi:hypothetical protein